MARSPRRSLWLRWALIVLFGIGGAVGAAYFAADRADRQARARLAQAPLDELQRMAEQAQHRRDPLVFYWLGVRLSEANRPKDAVLALARAVLLDEKSPRSRYALGVALDAVNRPREAEDQLKQAIALEPNSAQSHFVLGKLYGKYSRWQESVTYLKKASALDPQDIEAPFLLALCYEELATRTHAPFREEARAILEKLEQRAPNDIRILKTLAGNYVFFNQISKAEALYRRIVALDPGDMKTRALLGRSLAEQAETPAALAESERLLTECLAKAPNSPGASLAMGILEARRERPAKAVPHIQRAIALGIEEPEAWFHLSRALAQCKRKEEARQANAIFQRKDAARLKIRGLEMRLGFYSEENESQRKENDAIRLQLAQVLMDEKRYPVALAHLQRILLRDPDHAEARRLARLCEEKASPPGR